MHSNNATKEWLCHGLNEDQIQKIKNNLLTLSERRHQQTRIQECNNSMLEYYGVWTADTLV